MERIVVGVDGSEEAAASLRWAARLAVGVGAEIIAVHAIEYPFAEVSPEVHERFVAERRLLLADEWTKPAVDCGASVRVKLQGGDPRTVALSVAESERADLLVLGRTGQGAGPGFLHLGSVAEYAGHHASVPLAIVPSGDWGPVHRIVLGVDGSEPSLAAVEWCVAVATSSEASVVAVAVEEAFIEWTPSTSPKNWRRDVERRLDAWTAPLTSAGVSVNRIAQPDMHPADGLLKATSEHGADLLVIGTRGVGGFTGLRAGGVAMKVLHRASVPLVLVPPAE